ncbi:MAG: pyrroline-5-carboxylate reductase [Alphaproteobacteria bacterium]|nr:pyrroline-5-carboxylate reductase [Alphaproteobacteria bacterium]
MLQNTSLLLIGCGKMGGAVLNGLLKNGLPAKNIRVAEPNDAIRALLTEKGISSAANIADLTDFRPDIVFLAVKPFLIEQVIDSVKPFTENGAAVLSIIAGRPIRWFKEKLGADTVVFRAMPNTPAGIGKGITGVVACDQAAEQQKQAVQAVLNSCGKVVWLNAESQIDAVTAVSGSGPAYVFYLTEALTQAAKALGLSDENAAKLAKETVIGSAALMAEGTETPAVLRKNVTTPNGTTAAALEVLMNPHTGFEPLLTQAVKAAEKRSKELANA